MRLLWIGLVVLAACSDSDANNLAGTWSIEQPGGWTDFRFTLDVHACSAASAPGPCDYAMTGSATSTPAVCKVPGMTALSRGQLGYTCAPPFPVVGVIVADDVALNLGAYTDGATVDLTGRLAGDRIFADIVFTDPAGVPHHVGACTPGPVCLESPGQVQFVRGGAAVGAANTTRLHVRDVHALAIGDAGW